MILRCANIFSKFNSLCNEGMAYSSWKTNKKLRDIVTLHATNVLFFDLEPVLITVSQLNSN